MSRGLHLLITGASGFIGQALARRALAKGHRVTALVRVGASAPTGAQALLHELGSGTPLRLPIGIDVVAHLAQSRAYRTFPGDAKEMFRVNVAGAQELLMAAAEAKISSFCLVSSGTVYEPFAGTLHEEAALAPTGNLGATKLASEVIARPFATLFRVSILRLFAPYGPGQTDRLVPDLIRRVRQGGAIALPFEGGGLRFSPTYIDDVCVAMLAAIEDSWNGVFNLAAPEALSIEEAALVIGKSLGKKPFFERKDLDSPVVVPNLARLGARYDLARFRSFADGITATIAAER
jgi:UDP-glucuronate 4-epimerase